MLLITVIATALGALVARSLYADPPPQTPAAVGPSQTSVPSSEQPGSSEVRGLADATTHPLYNTLRGQLQKLFDAINKKDFKGYADTVTAERLAQTPEEQWLDSYSTTRDGSIVMYRIEADDRSARVLLKFTSTQDPAKAPTEMPYECLNWNVVYGFAKERGEWKLTAGLTASTPTVERCP